MTLVLWNNQLTHNGMAFLGMTLVSGPGEKRGVLVAAPAPAQPQHGLPQPSCCGLAQPECRRCSTGSHGPAQLPGRSPGLPSVPSGTDCGVGFAHPARVLLKALTCLEAFSEFPVFIMYHVAR